VKIGGTIQAGCASLIRTSFAGFQPPAADRGSRPVVGQAVAVGIGKSSLRSAATRSISSARRWSEHVMGGRHGGTERPRQGRARGREAEPLPRRQGKSGRPKMEIHRHLMPSRGRKGRKRSVCG